MLFPSSGAIVLSTSTHRQIIEEAPVTIAKDKTFEKMERAAARLAKPVGYVCARIVECECFIAILVDDHSDFSLQTFTVTLKTYFIFLNSILIFKSSIRRQKWSQVSIFRLQIAMGIPLHRI